MFLERPTTQAERPNLGMRGSGLDELLGIVAQVEAFFVGDGADAHCCMAKAPNRISIGRPSSSLPISLTTIAWVEIGGPSTSAWSKALGEGDLQFVVVSGFNSLGPWIHGLPQPRAKAARISFSFG